MLSYLDEPDAPPPPVVDRHEAASEALAAPPEAVSPPPMEAVLPPKPPSPPKPPPPAEEEPLPPPDPEAEAAFAKVDAFLAHSLTKVFELFRKMDSDLDGRISASEMITGFTSLQFEMSAHEVAAFIRKVDPSGGGTTSLKALAKALRPGQSVKSLLKPRPDGARDVDSPISATDMMPDGLTEEEAAQMKAEAHLKAGRLPSLSPDDEDGTDSPRTKKGNLHGTEYVWNQLETRIAPDGVAKAPAWQRGALQRAQWTIDVTRRKEIREARAIRDSANPIIPSWDRPGGRSKKHLLERELRQQRVRVDAEAMEGMDGLASASFAMRTGGPATAGASTLSSFSGDVGLLGENPARRVLDGVDMEDTSKAHATWLQHTADTHEGATTQRVNKIAFYEQALQQLQLQRQELDNSLDSAKSGIDTTQRSGKCSAIDARLRSENFRRTRLKADLLEVQTKANAMTTSTQALMHVINSLRITRKRHVQRVVGLNTKERTMDNDAQFLLGSASGAMEERERLRSKHERLKHEASAWRTMQLKEAAEQGEKLDDLDAEQAELENRLVQLDEQATRLHYQSLRNASTTKESRNLKYGYLRGQVAGWAAEFARVTDITGVRFGEGKSDAVDKVVSIYSANELRNKSLFKFVTEDIVLQTETLQTELAAEEALATQLEDEQEARDSSDAAAAASSIEASASGEHLIHQLEKASAAVDTILPLVEKLGISCMDAAHITLPQHMEGKAIAPPTVPAFLALLEDALHHVLSSASAIVQARAPVKPVSDDDSKRAPTPPPEEVTPTLATLRSATQQRTLASGKDAAKMLHNDSSERLLQMS